MRAMFSQDSASEPGTVPHSGRHYDCSRCSFLAGCGNDRGHTRRGRCDDGKIRRLRQLLEGFDRSNAFDFVIARIDNVDRTGEARFFQIFDYRAARRRSTRASADHDDRARRKQLLEPISRHR